MIRPILYATTLICLLLLGTGCTSVAVWEKVRGQSNNGEAVYKELPGLPVKVNGRILYLDVKHVLISKGSITLEWSDKGDREGVLTKVTINAEPSEGAATTVADRTIPPIMDLRQWLLMLNNETDEDHSTEFTSPQ